ERAGIPEKYTWNLADLYADEAAWTRAKDDVAKRIPKFAAEHKGHVADSEGTLLTTLNEWMEIDRVVSQLANYAMQLSDQDTRAARPLEMKQETDQLRVDLQAATSFIRPEILAARRDRMVEMVARAQLKPYRPFLDDTLRRADHT